MYWKFSAPTCLSLLSVCVSELMKSESDSLRRVNECVCWKFLSNTDDLYKSNHVLLLLFDLTLETVCVLHACSVCPSLVKPWCDPCF